MSYSKKRYLTYSLLTIFIFVVPFITIDDNHLLLLSFEKQQFQFVGYAFNVNELFIMPFLLMILFIGIFAMTTIFGRVWCGWACPQTIFRVIYRDLIESTILDYKRIKNKQKELDTKDKKVVLKKYLSVILWSLISIIIATNFMWYFVPPEDFFEYMKNPMDHTFMIIFILSIAGFLVYDIIIMKENFCMFICPYSRIQSVLYDNDTKQVVYDTNRGGDVYVNREKSIFKMKEWSANEECTTCEACVKICPTHIDIRKGLQVECINCLECSDACETVMGKLGKKSLINWGSTNQVINKKLISKLSIRNASYFASIVLCVLFTIYYTSEQEPFLVNINKTTSVYKINKDTSVSNNYVLTFYNSQDKTYTFDIKINDDRFTTKRFKAFKLDAKKRAKKVFILKTTRKLDLSNDKNTLLSVNVTVFAKEDPSIKIERKLPFVYPRSDLIPSK